MAEEAGRRSEENEWDGGKKAHISVRRMHTNLQAAHVRSLRPESGPERAFSPWIESIFINHSQQSKMEVRYLSVTLLYLDGVGPAGIYRGVSWCFPLGILVTGPKIVSAKLRRCSATRALPLWPRYRSNTDTIYTVSSILSTRCQEHTNATSCTSGHSGSRPRGNWACYPALNRLPRLTCFTKQLQR
ncbi:hypothetical protein VTK56DRAFT_8524 [Thermocarpiscus australiensis]